VAPLKPPTRQTALSDDAAFHSFTGVAPLKHKEKTPSFAVYDDFPLLHGSGPIEAMSANVPGTRGTLLSTPSREWPH